MATQKNSKSSRATTSKGKSSKVAPVKKSAAKAPAKRNQAVKPVSNAKSKTSGKSLSSAKTKKAAPVAKKATTVAKKVAPVAKKTALKPAPKSAARKQSPAKPSPAKSKVAPVKKAKQAHSKPASALKVASKATHKPVSTSKAVSSKASKPTIKPQPKASSSSGKKSSATVHAVSAKTKTVTPKQITPAASVQSKVSKAPVKTQAPSRPETKARTVETLKFQHKGITSKPAVVTAKSAVKPTGSKASDLAKPAVSSRPLVETPKDQPKAKEFQRKSLKQSTVHPVKPSDIMSEKKENKSVGAMHSDEPQKTRYNDKELEEFDQLIDQKLIVAREQLEFYLKQLEDMAENPDNKIKGLDDGLSTLESERISSMAARQQKLIQHLENAKIRIKNKVYGICRETGRLISKERLRAVPHATLSIEAKQAQN